MVFRARNAEVNAVVELLESDDFATDVALATALVKTCFKLFQDRDTYALVVDFAGKRTVYGPYASEGDAARAHERYGVGNGYVGMLWAPQRAVPGADPVLSSLCPKCQHPKGAHSHRRMAGRCAALNCTCTQ